MTRDRVAADETRTTPRHVGAWRVGPLARTRPSDAKIDPLGLITFYCTYRGSGGEQNPS